MPAELVMSQSAIDNHPNVWKSARQLGISASQVAALLGIANPEYGSPYELYVEKVTGQDMRGDSDAMARGRHLEPYVVERFADHRPELHIAEGGLYRNTERRWQMATFDRLAFDTDRGGWLGPITDPSTVYPVQIKTSALTPRYSDPGPDEWGEPGTDQIPAPYRAQCLAEMDTWGAELVIVPVLFMLSWKVEVYYLKRDRDAEGDIRLIREECEAFMQRIADQDPPPVDWTPATARALRTINPIVPGTRARIPRELADRYKAARLARDRADQRLGLAVNQMMERSEGAASFYAVVDGQEVPVATRRKFTRHGIDGEKLRREHPAIAKDCEKVSPVDSLWAGSWAKGEQ